jgi:drug/metabolite transporter (DMT)-like permease
VEALVTSFAVNQTNARPQRLGGIASRGSRRPADGDRVPAVLDYGRARQAVGAAARQLSDCLLPLLLWVYRDPAFRPSHAGSSRLLTTHFCGHFLRGAVDVAGLVAGFYATTRLPLTDSTAISFTAPLFMILTAIFLLGEKVR